MDSQSNLLRECREKEFHAYGTHRVFERRAKSYRKYLNILTFFGIIGPVLVGAVILSFGSNLKYLSYLVAAAGIIGIIQFTIAVWALVSGWSGKLELASNAVQGNIRLYNEWKALADHPDERLEDRVRELRRLNQEQEVSDIRQDVTDKEKRFAMRSSLFYYKRPCQTCGQTPTSTKPGKCDMCGNF